MLTDLGPSSTSGKAGQIVSYEPAIVANDLCTPLHTIDVPLNGKSQASLTIGLQTLGATSSGTTADADKIKLKCHAPK